MSRSIVPAAKILLIDPDPESWVRISSIISSAGHSSLEVPDQYGAISVIAGQQVDLVIMRVMGDETAAWDMPNVIHDLSPNEYVPVIVMCGSMDEDARCRYLEAGADDVISDAIGWEELRARIESLLRIKALHNQLAASREALQQALRRERRLLEKLRRDNAHLQTLATTDALTHVQNARSFREILEHEFKAARRYGYPLSLMMIDVDHFKVVNDTHGHPSGDYVLKETAVILKRSVRDSDVVSRTGGEEFTILLPRADRKQVAKFAERVRKEVRDRKFIVYGSEIHVTVSVGLSSYPDDAEVIDARMLLYFADQALLIAKETGRDRVVAVADIDSQTRQRLRRQYLGAPHCDELPDDASGQQHADPPPAPMHDVTVATGGLES